MSAVRTPGGLIVPQSAVPAKRRVITNAFFKLLVRTAREARPHKLTLGLVCHECRQPVNLEMTRRILTDLDFGGQPALVCQCGEWEVL